MELLGEEIQWSIRRLSWEGVCQRLWVGGSSVRERLVGAGRVGQLLTSRRSWNSRYDLRRDWYGECPELALEEDRGGCLVGTGFRLILCAASFSASD